MVPINFVSVLVSTIALSGLGYVWYGRLFGKEWQALTGLTEEHMAETQKNIKKNYAIMALGALVMSYVLALSLIFATAFLKVTGILAGLEIGLWMWMGFIAPVTLGTVLWEGKPWKLWMINAGYYLVGLLTAGVILSLWA